MLLTIVVLLLLVLCSSIRSTYVPRLVLSATSREASGCSVVAVTINEANNSGSLIFTTVST